MIALRKKAETNTTITLEWDPVPGAIGYRFQSASQSKWSHTFDPARTEVKFSKAASYKVEALGVEDAGQYPQASPPSGAKLRWAPPALSSPVTVDFTNASHTAINGAGRDAKIVVKEKLTAAAQTHSRIEGWRHAVLIGGEADFAQETQFFLVPREMSGTMHIEGLYSHGAGLRDAIGVRWRVPIVQIVNVRTEVHYTGGEHSDCFQTQEASIDELRIDKATFVTDYQAITLINEPSSKPGTDANNWCKVGKTLLSRINFRPRAGKYPATWIYKAIPSKTATPLGEVFLDDVWAPDFSPGDLFYPSSKFVDWRGQAHKYGCFVEQDAQGRYVRWSTPVDVVPGGPLAGQTCGDCGIRGVVRLHPESAGPSGGDFVPASSVGMGYVSPGYA